MATLIKIFGPLIKNAVSMKSSASGSNDPWNNVTNH